jgi:hypothetical protein
MNTYVANIRLKRITPIPRDPRLDVLMEDLGFFPFRPGVPPEGLDENAGFTQWEYAGNHALAAAPLQAMLEGRIKHEVQEEIGVTVSRVRIRAACFSRAIP